MPEFYCCAVDTRNREVSPRSAGRSLSYAAFAVIVVVYLAIIQFGGRLIGNWADESDTLTTRGVFFTMVIPLGSGSPSSSPTASSAALAGGVPS